MIKLVLYGIAEAKDLLTFKLNYNIKNVHFRKDKVLYET